MAENRRVKMTKRMLKDALLELLEDQAAGKITVTDICERADVNRSTFYSYYNNIDELLLEIEDDVLNNLPGSPCFEVTADDAAFLSALEDFFAFVMDNKRLFRVLIVQRDDSSFNHRLVNSVMTHYRKNSESINDLIERYEYIYCVNGVIGIMKEWINEDFPISIKDFAQIVLEMSAKATS